MSQTFGALLKQVRKRNGMTQQQLADKLGYSRSLVAALEVDQRLPDVDAVVRVFIPALNLEELPGLATQLVELAAQARHEAPPAVVPRIDPEIGQRRSQPHKAEHSPRPIPVAPTRMLGRDSEIELFCDQFLTGDTRLLTLVGPPGVGKTRLAQAVAARLQLFYRDHACFVPLAGVYNPDFVADSILTALDANRTSERPALERLVGHLRHQEILLLLDNFEQILPAAPLVAQLLAECPGVRVLATSRERLHLRAEHVVRVQPLAPTAAMDLFSERARASEASQLFSDENREVVEAICRQLDYLPLAIELCAAQADFFTLDQLLKRVQARPLDTLAGGAADLPPHQRSLRTAIQTSYDLLTPDERALFRVLSVFAGGCNPEIVNEVWSADPARASVSSDGLLRSLAVKSLIRIEATPMGDRRVQILESICAFARERLQEEGEEQAALARHFDAHLRYGHVVQLHLAGRQAVDWAKRIEMDLDNIRLALQWAFDAGRYQEYALLAISMQIHWHRRGLIKESTDWFEKILPHCHKLDADTHLMVKVLYIAKAFFLQLRDQWNAIQAELRELVAACEDPICEAHGWRWIAALSTDMEAGAEAYERAIQLSRTGVNRPKAKLAFGPWVDKDIQLSKNLEHYGNYLIDRGETVRSAEVLTESYRLSDIDFNGGAYAIGGLGRRALAQGEVETAYTRLYEAVEIGVRMDDLMSVCQWRPFLALAMLYMGDVGGARSQLARSLEECSELGAVHKLARSCCFSAEAALCEGNAEEARGLFAQSLTYDVEYLDSTVFPVQRALLAARLAAATGRDALAAQLYGAAHTLRGRIIYNRRDPMYGLADAALEPVRARLGEGAFDESFARGQRMALGEGLALMARI